ncbi:MAG: phosphoenolpyruvate synthase, partial [Gemmatimonadetes bacterium]|nr:phosphoenolpyruvate synthase [Gemmatimonadota bacterium]
VERGLLVEADDLCYLTVEEALGTVQGTCSTADLRRLVALRKSDYDTFARRTPRPRLCTTRIPGLELSYEESGAATTTTQLQGTGCSAGSGCGQARIITEPGTPLGPGSHILVARSTDPGWVFLMIESKGIIVERGSLLSHTAIVGRELGIPTVVGVAGATEQIPEGARVQIDGSTGMIQWN